MAVSEGIVGFYFLHGIANEDARATQEVLQKIIQSSPHFKSIKTYVAVLPNNLALTEQSMHTLVLATIKALEAYFPSLHKEVEREWSLVSKIAQSPVKPASIVDYAKIREDTQKAAKALALRINIFLKENRSHIANLLLHSQAAEIGYQALPMIPCRDRVRMITLGAITTIPDEMCAQVMHYRFTGDVISRLLSIPFEIGRRCVEEKKRTVIVLKTEKFFCSSGDYLAHPAVQQSIQDLVDPSPKPKKESIQTLSLPLERLGK